LEGVIASMEKDKLMHAIWLTGLDDEERMYYEA